MSAIELFSKDEYLNIVQTQRRDFVHQHFSVVLGKVYNRMREQASKMKNCHFEVTFEIPSPYDINQMERILQAYFRDLGYTPISAPRKSDDTNIVTLTLT